MPQKNSFRNAKPSLMNNNIWKIDTDLNCLANSKPLIILSQHTTSTVNYDVYHFNHLSKKKSVISDHYDGKV